jgi:AraC-like DNA-binding protein
MEGTMRQKDDLAGTPLLDYETWRATLRSMHGRYTPEGIEPRAFSGWVGPIDVWGFKALNIGSNAPRTERTHGDIRLDGVDHYFVLFQLTGQAVLKHNDQALRLSVGDVALVDAARPATYLADNGSEPWSKVTLNLPRTALVSHLGFDPQGGIFRRSGTPAAGLLLNLIGNTIGAEESKFGLADSYMRLAIYDLVGALFASSEPWPTSRPRGKLFARMRALAKNKIEDPDFGPVELASAAGISLRYAQKLFTAHGLTCSGFIYSLRLEHAARLLQRRASLRTGQPLSEIAYASGFRDYSHFARKFRRRFGYAAGAYCAD